MKALVSQYEPWLSIWAPQPCVLWPGEAGGPGGRGIHFTVGDEAEALGTDGTCGDPLP